MPTRYEDKVYEAGYNRLMVDTCAFLTVRRHPTELLFIVLTSVNHFWILTAVEVQLEMVCIEEWGMRSGPRTLYLILCVDDRKDLIPLLDNTGGSGHVSGYYQVCVCVCVSLHSYDHLENTDMKFN